MKTGYTTSGAGRKRGFKIHKPKAYVDAAVASAHVFPCPCACAGAGAKALKGLGMSTDARLVRVN